jgi:hypothetical protein
MASYRPELATRGLLSNREKWEADFKAFLKEQGRASYKTPLMGFKEVDFYSLYKEVVCWGGYEKVIQSTHNTRVSRIVVPVVNCSITEFCTPASLTST